MSELISSFKVDVYREMISLAGFSRDDRITQNQEIRIWIDQNISWADYWIDSQLDNSIDGLTFYKEQDFNLFKLVFGERYKIKRRMTDRAQIEFGTS